MRAQLRIKSSHLREAVRPILRANGSSAASEITLSYEDGHLVISQSGVTATIPAIGEWTGLATAHASALGAIAMIRDAQIDVVFGPDGHLHIGNMSFEARWSEGTQHELDLPLEPTLIDVLRLRLAHSDEELLAHGLLERVSRAEHERDRRIERAADALRTIGDFESSIARLVQDEVCRNKGRED